MTQGIIDTDELEKLEKFSLEVVLQNDDGDKWIRASELRALIASSPQADGTVLDPSEYRLDYSTGTPILMHKDCSVIEGKEAVAIFELLSAYKPQADDKDNCEVCKGAKGGVKGNENIVNGKVMCDYCHAEQSQADDVRKDAERYRWLRHGDNDELVIRQGNVDKNYHWLPRLEHLDSEIDKHMASDAIDKARE